MLGRLSGERGMAATATHVILEQRDDVIKAKRAYTCVQLHISRLVKESTHFE